MFKLVFVLGLLDLVLGSPCSGATRDSDELNPLGPETTEVIRRTETTETIEPTARPEAV